MHGFKHFTHVYSTYTIIRADRFGQQTVRDVMVPADEMYKNVFKSST